GSHFYLAMYWAQTLAAQDDDAALKATFIPLADALTREEATIVGELNGAQGHAVDMRGYYHPDLALLDDAMRPSATLNAALAILSGHCRPSDTSPPRVPRPRRRCVTTALR